MVDEMDIGPEIEAAETQLEVETYVEVDYDSVDEATPIQIAKNLDDELNIEMFTSRKWSINYSFADESEDFVDSDVEDEAIQTEWASLAASAEEASSPAKKIQGSFEEFNDFCT